MSTLSSWIDTDEISELMPLLLPKSREENPDELSEELSDDSAEASEAPGVPGKVDREAGATEPEEAASEEAAPSEAVDAAISGNDQAFPEQDAPAENLPDKTEPEIDFSIPEAYHPEAFPETANLAEDAGEPDRQAAAAQAAVTLERARDRANEGGLLKNAGAAPDPAPGSGEEVDESAPQSSASPPAAEAEIEFPEVEESESAPAPAPDTLRGRLAHFVDAAIQLTGGSDPVVTDFQSYPLYPSASDNGAGSARSIDSIVRMNRLISRLPDQPNGDSEKTAQISLADNRWLCVLTQGSAAGGVCAALQIPGPISNETAEQLHLQLHAALTGQPG